MKFNLKNETYYNADEQSWAKKFEEVRQKDTLNSTQTLIKKTDFELFEETAQNFENKNEVLQFFVKEFLEKQLSNIESITGTNLKSINTTPVFRYEHMTNRDILNDGIKNIKMIYEHYSEKEKINEILNDPKNKEKLSNISVDKNMSPLMIYLLDKKVDFNFNNLLNMSIRNGYQELFDTTLKHFKGEKKNFENLRDNPFFWSPLMLSKKNDDLTKYFHDQLIENGFEIKQDDLKKIMDLNKNNPVKLNYLKDVETTLGTEKRKQRNLKF